MMWLVYISFFLFLYDLMIQANFIVYNVIEVFRFLCVLKRETGTMVIGSGKVKRPAFRVIMYDSSDV